MCDELPRSRGTVTGAEPRPERGPVRACEWRHCTLISPVRTLKVEVSRWHARSARRSTRPTPVGVSTGRAHRPKFAMRCAPGRSQRPSLTAWYGCSHGGTLLQVLTHSQARGLGSGRSIAGGGRGERDWARRRHEEMSLPLSRSSTSTLAPDQTVVCGTVGSHDT